MRTKLNPLLISLVIFVVWVTIIVVIPKFQPDSAGTKSLDESVSQGIDIYLLTAPIFLLGVVLILGWRREVGLKAVEPPRSWLNLWLPALFVTGFYAIAVLAGLSFTQTLIFVFINTILVGISEELMFRGIVFYGALTQFRVWTAIIFTTVLFGAVHVLNGFSTGDFTSSSIQAVTAGMSGLWFMAIRLRTKSIFPGMLIHGLWDGGLFLVVNALKARFPAAPPAANDLPLATHFILPVLFVLPLFLYGLWLLRGIGNKDKEELLR
jgi:uncharacterized protein